ncbi:MAG TPA: hypothetical protein VJ736_11110, partial [Actinomycetota bacterium]|nr:hypothetical protein [Actinomycetota bacterium]
SRGMTVAKALDLDRLREARSLVEGADVEAAIQQLAPMVSRRRFTRPSGRLAESLEIDEVTGWLTSALEDPTSDDARFYVERAYYKLRRYRSAEPRAGK